MFILSDCIGTGKKIDNSVKTFECLEMLIYLMTGNYCEKWIICLLVWSFSLPPQTPHFRQKLVFLFPHA